MHFNHIYMMDDEGGDLMELDLNVIPSGVESLDRMIGGGFPSGSFILLHGEVGAGSAEFLHTSLINSVRLLDEISLKKVCYITFTRLVADVKREIALSFDDKVQNIINDNRIIFKDFSKECFQNSALPFTWNPEFDSSFEALKGCGDRHAFLELLVSFLNDNANESVIIFDSLTDLVRLYYDSMGWQDLIAFLKGLQRESKRWGGLVYGTLTSDIFNRGIEEEIADCADGVIVFRWDETETRIRRRSLYIRKFRGLLPVLEETKLLRLETKFTPGNGFEVMNIKMVRGE
ncbi:hypothetical protein DRN98_01820 [Methanosarcinales archaeon]|nr:MAG: hypothetical protein DRN98_01820 [Methanosarcinales archaeon]